MDPGLRGWLREEFMRAAVVTTMPTPKGLDHPLMEPYAKWVGAGHRVKGAEVLLGFRGAWALAAHALRVPAHGAVRDVGEAGVAEGALGLQWSRGWASLRCSKAPAPASTLAVGAAHSRPRTSALHTGMAACAAW